jgi:hypothetical protein
MKLTKDPKVRPDIPDPHTVWAAISRLNHDFREEIDRHDSTVKVHSYLCRSCRIELLRREATYQLGRQ